MPGARISRGTRVTLRTVEDDDLPFLQRAYANPELRYPLGAPLLNQEELEEWLTDENADRFLVCLDGDRAGPGRPDDADDVHPIGLVTIEDADWRRPELVYWLVPEVHGDGYGREAVSLVIDYIFGTYETPAAGATVYEFNDASRGLLESLGFDEEGRIRKDRFVDGECVDSIVYGLLRENWTVRPRE
ncbi:GNAT family N-acetyltransferase [Natronorubrum tibetense]|uniref:GNAT family N-acetyltransferase n=1 Tax=Natronorubrum tibetense TaxID=63128 RepID=UPI000485768D|nr:GNAT family protein [Natronorubrum tibetense]